MSKKNIGNDSVLVDYGLFKFKNTDTITVKSQWVAHGSLYGSSKKLYAYLICELFDWEQIEKFTDINYDGLSPDKREEAMNFDRQIINSFALDEIPCRIYMDGIPYTITYKLIWE